MLDGAARSAAAGFISIALPVLLFGWILHRASQVPVQPTLSSPAQPPAIARGLIAWGLGEAVKLLLSLLLMAASIGWLGTSLRWWAFLGGIVIATKTPMIFVLLRQRYRRHRMRA